MRSPLGQRGFSLLESVVALVIIASAGWALFSWLNASIVSLRRVEDANARSAATVNAVEFMQSVNPMQRPQGQVDLGDTRIRWTATPLTQPLAGVNPNRGRSDFDLALYDTVVRASRDDRPWFELRMKLVGYKRVRQTVSPFSLN
jgi:general secretion pathway protein I